MNGSAAPTNVFIDDFIIVYGLGQGDLFTLNGGQVETSSTMYVGQDSGSEDYVNAH